MDIIDVVDDNDCVIGTMSRKEAHSKGYNVRIAATLVFTSAGKIVLQRISHLKQKDPLKWSYSSAGHVNAGEDYPEAALRELEEELGIRGGIERYIGMSRTIDPITNENKAFHRVFKVNHDGPFHFDENEVEEIKEFTLNELAEMVNTNPFQFKQNLLEILKKII